MSDAATVAIAREAEGTSRWPGLRTSLLYVAGFWWLATGVLIAVQRNEATRVTSAIITTLLMLFGVWLMKRTAPDASRHGVTLSFLGGALVWLGVSSAFYGGWIVGVSSGDPLAPPRSLALAWQAISATIYSDVLGLAMLALAFVVSRGGPNHTGLWTIALFWLAHQFAKLNVFLGVENAGLEYLPQRLTYLAGFFGPPENTLFLPVTIAALLLMGVMLLHRARRAAHAWEQRRDCMLGIVVLLAAFEHALLGVSAPPSLWETFLHLRGES